ncbi:MAG: SoxR reducing system RseC family protein [Bacteroidales bacterium]|nr:SoxR reducing system RseC family protein [Bacteroidales bacterium]
MSEIAKHDGKVIAVEKRTVKVEMHVLSACSSCKAHEKCGFVDKADKIVEIETENWEQYAVGDTVTVSVNESLGLLAVLLAYIVPAVLIIGGVVALSLCEMSEALVATLPILVVAIYFLFLYSKKDKLQKHFSFGISKI